MGMIAFLSALAFLLVYWITAWSFFLLLARVCGVIVVLCTLIGLIKAILS